MAIVIRYLQRLSKYTVYRKWCFMIAWTRKKKTSFSCDRAEYSACYTCYWFPDKGAEIFNLGSYLSSCILMYYVFTNEK